MNRSDLSSATLCRRTRLGRVSATVRAGKLVRVSMGSGAESSQGRSGRIHRLFFKQFDEYSRGVRRRFTLPVALQGTDFQRRVWGRMSRIAYGRTLTYGQLARGIGSPRAFRAVGAAVGANPLAIVLPCHRVLAGHGLGGYAFGLELKKRLLRIEGPGGRR